MTVLARTGAAEDLQAFLSEHEVEEPNEQGLTLAQLAARAGNIPLLAATVEAGANLDGTMALAATGGQRAVIEYLLAQGRDINEKRKDRYPMSFALPHGPDFCEFLIEKGAIDTRER
jgi:ankyrin repeat protein